MQQKELDKLKEELQRFLTEKLKDKPYMAAVSFIDDYTKDEKTGNVNIMSHFVRVANVDLESKYIQVTALVGNIKAAIEQMIAGAKNA